VSVCTMEGVDDITMINWRRNVNQQDILESRHSWIAATFLYSLTHCLVPVPRKPHVHILRLRLFQTRPGNPARLSPSLHQSPQLFRCEHQRASLLDGETKDNRRGERRALHPVADEGIQLRPGRPARGDRRLLQIHDPETLRVSDASRSRR
jgi:hypothetical protein